MRPLTYCSVVSVSELDTVVVGCREVGEEDLTYLCGHFVLRGQLWVMQTTIDEGREGWHPVVQVARRVGSAKQVCR